MKNIWQSMPGHITATTQPAGAAPVGLLLPLVCVIRHTGYKNKSNNIQTPSWQETHILCTQALEDADAQLQVQGGEHPKSRAFEFVRCFNQDSARSMDIHKLLQMPCDYRCFTSVKCNSTVSRVLYSNSLSQVRITSESPPFRSEQDLRWNKNADVVPGLTCQRHVVTRPT